MKQVLTLFLTTITLIGFSQINMHNATIIGSINIGNKDITSVLDETTGCVHKSNLHSKNLFTSGESVQLKIKENGSQPEIIKPNLPKKVFTDKCNNGNLNINLDPFSNNNYMEEYGLVIREAIIETNKLNKVHDPSKDNLTKEQQWKDTYTAIVDQKFAAISAPKVTNPVLGSSAKKIFDTYVDKIKLSNRTAIIKVSKAFEKKVLSSTTLTIDEQSILLALISEIKHFKTVLMEEEGLIYANGELPYDPNNPIEVSDWCDKFNNCMRRKVPDGPVAGVIWVLSGTIYVSVADCIIEASGW